jgi:hypothetical protein
MSNTTLKKNIIAVEGKDELAFLLEYFKRNGMSEESIEIKDFEGKENFKSRTKLLTEASGFSGVEKLILIRDADYATNDKDGAHENALKSLQGILKHASLPVPYKSGHFTDITKGKPQVAVYIMPYGKIEGMFEDLLLESLENYKIKCVNTFLDCMKVNIPKNKLPKAKVHSYLAAHAEPKSDFKGSMTNSTSYWDFNHECFAELKSLLVQL